MALRVTLLMATVVVSNRAGRGREVSWRCSEGMREVEAEEELCKRICSALEIDVLFVL